MQPAATRRIESILALPRNAKKTLAIMADSALCVLTVWLAICLRFESWVSLAGYQWFAVALSVLLAIPLLTAFGFYHTVIRYVGRQTITAALRAIAFYALIYSAVFTAYGLPLVPRTIGILQPLLLLIGLAFIRLMASQLLSEQDTNATSNKELPGVLIYGAGNSGQQLASSLKASGQTQIIGFIDDNSGIQNARIAGTVVYSPNAISELAKQHNLRSVLLAMPRLSRSRRNEIIRQLTKHAVAVRTLPSLSDLVQGKVTEDQLREIELDDLLGRDPVAPISSLLNKNISNKIVMVTGAGGSIGSELCRQILKLYPRELVLLDLNEFSLYTIIEELQPVATQLKLKLTPVLVNVQFQQQIAQAIDRYRPDIIYHAAAYKHVPLVESNPVVGLQNNVLGTYNVALAATKANVKDMVLISTDKAVRPTNVMGASKRISEMVLQVFAKNPTENPHSTRFSIVRFGNVLGSSGSVIPKFKEQIKRGGPITLTHPEVTRYFMTIPEAALLVIQAAAMPTELRDTASVYLLDMGESVKILDLAKTLIQLSGKNEFTEHNPDGGIAIEFIGLRPGEKLYEELLIENTPSKTAHPKIMTSNDAGSADPVWVLQTIEAIQQLHLAQDSGAIGAILSHPGIGYSSSHA